MKKQLYKLLIILSFNAAVGQVGINTTTPAAQLDVRSSNQATPSNTDGILIPKVDVFPTTNPTAAQNGMMVFLTTAVGVNPSGFYYWDSTTSTWIGLASSTSGWALTGNTGTVPGTNFLGTTDAKDFVFKTNNSERARFTSGGFLGIGTTTPAQQLQITGNFRLPASTSTAGIIYSSTNRLIHTNSGFFSGVNAGSLTATGFGNTGVGSDALTAITSGTINSAFGNSAMNALTTGFNNAAFGHQSMLSTTTAGDNTAVGSQSLKANTTGSRNTTIGSQSMGGNTTGSDNVAIGYGTLGGPLTGVFNSAVGNGAMSANTSGFNNAAFGREALPANTTGSRNTALGYGTLHTNITGGSNTAIGTEAGYSTIGSGNVMLGYQAGYSEAGSNKLYIDNSNTANPLVYGDFNTNLFRVNGTLNINNAYSLPTADGTAGRVLTTNGAGVVSWSASASESDPTAWLKGGNAGTTAGTDFLGTTDFNDFVFKTNNVERARFLKTGFMGIGVNAPEAYLDIYGNNGDTNSLLLRSGNNNNDFGASQIAFSWNGTNNTKHSIRSRHNAFGDSGNTIEFVLWDQGTDGISDMGTKRVMTIDGDGNGKVGIGTASPAKELHVVGEIRASSLTGTGARMVQTDANGTLIPLAEGTASQVLLGTGVWGSVPGITNDWSFTGNSGTVAGTNFIGTTDNVDLVVKTNNAEQVRLTGSGFLGIGTSTPNEQFEITKNFRLPATTSATGIIYSDANTLIHTNTGFFSGINAGKLTATGQRNTGVGNTALGNLTTGNYNTAVGMASLNAMTTGYSNTAIGHQALTLSTTGADNTALGAETLRSNTTGSRNVAVGGQALNKSVSTSENVAVGYYALGDVVTGQNNTAIGTNSLFVNTSGFNNSAVGGRSLMWNTTGGRNTSLGWTALATNTTGNNNTAIGYGADVSTSGLTNATALGYNAKVASSNSLVLGGTGGDAVNVGIGTTSPTQAKVVINGTQDNTLSYGYLMSDGTIGTSSGTSGYSIYATGKIAATEFNAFSDERIKTIKGISNSSKDLETLNKIQITDYTFKDSIGKGLGTNKKVIAQQVKKVYPQAVSEITDVIPDIYAVAKIKDGRVILKNSLQKGDRVKLVFDNRTEIVDILQADEFGFNVAVKDEGKVFVFGREVKDFHTVDYEALSTLNISATQELIKIINQQEAQIRGLKADNTDMNKRLSQTEADINQIKSMFNNTISSNSK